MVDSRKPYFTSFLFTEDIKHRTSLCLRCTRPKFTDEERYEFEVTTNHGLSKAAV
jgi:hypothetical protein